MNYEYPPIGGGGANVAHPLAATLVSRGHSVDVVTSGMRGLPGTETVDGVNVHRIRCIRRHRHFTTTAELMTWIWPAYRKALQLNALHQYDLNHTHFALPTGLASYLLYKKTGLPYVTTIHGSDVPGYNPDRFRIAHRLVQPVWRRVVRNSARVVSASQFLRALIRSHIEVPVDVVRNGYAEKFGDSPPARKRNRILVVTRMFPRKGVQHFVQALAGLQHDWEVVIAGDGPYLPQLRDQVRRMGLDVNFVGFVQGDTLAELYATSKIFVFPSLQENFPTVLLEAMEAGCAIITTDSDGCAEVVGDAGIAIAPERPDQIHDALVLLMTDESRVEALSARARQRIKRFRWPRIAAQYEKLMQDTLAAQTEVTLESPTTVRVSERKQQRPGQAAPDDRIPARRASSKRPVEMAAVIPSRRTAAPGTGTCPKPRATARPAARS
jgi:glycosyltransferase involved in cell wall biosynthesis